MLLLIHPYFYIYWISLLMIFYSLFIISIEIIWHRDILQRTTCKLNISNWIRCRRGRVSFLFELSTNQVWRGEEIRTLKTILLLWKERHKHIWKFSLRSFSLGDIPVPIMYNIQDGPKKNLWSSIQPKLSHKLRFFVIFFFYTWKLRTFVNQSFSYRQWEKCYKHLKIK